MSLTTTFAYRRGDPGVRKLLWSATSLSRSRTLRLREFLKVFVPASARKAVPRDLPRRSSNGRPRP